MHIISRKKLIDFAEAHPDSSDPLDHWYRIVKSNDFEHFVDLRETFPSADLVGRHTVFNIGGNKYRLIASIHYNRSKLYIRHILTHSEYDKGDWKT